jgi:hypothetical protein
MIMNPAARTALDCLDIAGEIVGFIDLHALLPVLLSDQRLRDAVRRILGPDRSLTSDLRLFVSSVPLTQWAMSMGCRTAGLCSSGCERRITLLAHGVHGPVLGLLEEVTCMY